MAELDFEPFVTEAFPGLEFYLSGDRDLITLNSVETSSDRKLPLLSVARQGYIVRHKVPGDFASIPPRDDGRIPLEGQPGLAPRRTAEVAARPRLIPAAPIAPVKAFQSEVRYKGRTPVRLYRNPEGTILFQVYIRGNWKSLLNIDPETGQVFRYKFTNHNTKIDLRAAGFCMSRDGGISIGNRQTRRDGRPTAEEGYDAPLPTGPIDPTQAEPDLVMAVREMIAGWAQQITDNATAWNATHAIQQRGGYGPGPNTGMITAADITRSLNFLVVGLDHTRGKLIEATAAPQPQPQGGGEGDVAIQPLPYEALMERVQIWEPAGRDVERIAEPAFTRQMAMNIPMDAWPTAFLPTAATANIVTFFRRYPDMFNHPGLPDGEYYRLHWVEFNEQDDEPVRNGRIYRDALATRAFIEVPARTYTGEGVPWGKRVRVLEVTWPDGQKLLHTLTTALQQAIDAQLYPERPQAEAEAVNPIMPGPGYGDAAFDDAGFDEDEPDQEEAAEHAAELEMDRRREEAHDDDLPNDREIPF